MAKTIAEINTRIKKGEAVIVTAEEIIDIVEEKGTAEKELPPIHHPSLLGIVELSRGCGRGCRFCTLSQKPMVHLPRDTILSDMETNVAGGLTSVVSGSEDFFRYGARGSRVNFDRLHGLLCEMKKIQGNTVKAGETLCQVHARESGRIERARSYVQSAYSIGGEQTKPGRRVLEEIRDDDLGKN